MPTGPMQWETIIWLISVIVAAFAIASPVVLAWLRAYRAVIGRIEAAEQLARTEAAAVRAELQEAMLHVAETYATKSGVTAAVERVEGAVERLAGQVEASVDRLSGRIDRLLESRASDPPPPRRRSTT